MIQTPILSDHNDTICTKNQTVIKKVSNNNFFLPNQSSWDTNRTTPFQYQSSLQETTYSRGLEPTDFDVTKHSDYFVWKDTSERVARRCDDTVDKKRVNSCVLKHLFLEGVEQPNISPQKPGNALSDALRMSRFQNFAAGAAKTRTTLHAICWNRVSRGFNKFISSN